MTEVRNAAKPWGYTYLYKHPWRGGRPERRSRWFKTQAERDDGIRDLLRRQRENLALTYTELAEINPDVLL